MNYGTVTFTTPVDGQSGTVHCPEDIRRRSHDRQGESAILCPPLGYNIHAETFSCNHSGCHRQDILTISTVPAKGQIYSSVVQTEYCEFLDECPLTSLSRVLRPHDWFLSRSCSKTTSAKNPLQILHWLAVPYFIVKTEEPKKYDRSCGLSFSSVRIWYSVTH